MHAFDVICDLLTPPTANRFLPLNSAISHRGQAKNGRRKIALFSTRVEIQNSTQPTPSPNLAGREPHSYRPSAFAASVSLSTRMTELAVVRLRTIVRLGEALRVVFFSSAVDFILPVNCRRSTTAVRAASGTAGKMNSPEAEPRHAAPPAACRPACGVLMEPTAPTCARGPRPTAMPGFLRCAPLWAHREGPPRQRTGWR